MRFSITRGWIVPAAVAMALVFAPSSWAASVWTLSSSPNRGADFNRLNAVTAVSSSDAWAVGLARNAPTGQWRTLTEHFDGTAWRLVASPNVGSSTNELDAVDAASGTDAWAVGQEFSGSAERTLAEHFDGVTWSVVPTPNVGAANNDLRGVAVVSSSDVWAVGSSLGAVIQPMVQHFDGTAWSVVPVPAPAGGGFLRAVAAVSSNDVWAVGGVGDDGDATLAEHWNGTAWSIVATPSSIFEDSLSAITVGSATDIWAAGNNGSSTLTEHWNGSAWSIVPSPNPIPSSQGNSFLTGIVELGPTDVWAVGGTLNFTQGSLGRTASLHFDGSTWSVVATPNRGTGSNVLLGVATPAPNALIAVGSARLNPAGPERTLVMSASQA